MIFGGMRVPTGSADKKILNTKRFTPTGQCGGGCINQGETYDTDNGQVFVKSNFKDGAKQMFEGEFASLEAIRATGAVRVPKPLHVVVSETGHGAALVMEALDMVSWERNPYDLGRQLANLHRHNQILIEKNDPSAVRRFGFHITTCCGFLPLDNTWKDDWIDFYVNNRIEPQIKLLENKGEDTGIREIWARAIDDLPRLFENVSVIPSLLHGDLWSGNTAEVEGELVIFDPGSFYGHSEFDFGIIKMFGGFNHSFYDGYRKVIPEEEGFDGRCDLYELFHQLNHWNHFGSGYKRSSIELLRRLSDQDV
ncbi:ketosamine-3-kinase [Galendromus occidentalis]|uniref:protein-ribulosamine 3-kinase n=1 Tax=Galendromus occidentalis TaxID=34638 RepID=A0AAJ7SIT3_9ACAR|nr:ketosamine-3-kinase [Galendromus occidentalis]